LGVHVGVDVDEPWADDMTFCIDYAVGPPSAEAADLSDNPILDENVRSLTGSAGAIDHGSTTKNQVAHRYPHTSGEVLTSPQVHINAAIGYGTSGSVTTPRF
jgi:hypothetical protein